MTSYNTMQAFDERRDIIIPGNYEQTLDFCAKHFIEVGQRSISEHGYFAVALSGGSTPKGIFSLLASKYHLQLDWKKVWLFWSDERAVLPDHKDSNYHMAMESGFRSLGIPQENIFRMQAEADIEAHAEEYEKVVKEKIGGVFDLIMLGMGNDGHTASLFPRTHALQSERLVAANYIPQQDAWRMTLTFDCINASRCIAIYVLGKEKSSTIKKVFLGPYDPDELPIQKIGTPGHRALWILDEAAAADF